MKYILSQIREMSNSAVKREFYKTFYNENSEKHDDVKAPKVQPWTYTSQKFSLSNIMRVFEDDKLEKSKKKTTYGNRSKKSFIPIPKEFFGKYLNIDRREFAEVLVEYIKSNPNQINKMLKWKENKVKTQNSEDLDISNNKYTHIGLLYEIFDRIKGGHIRYLDSLKEDIDYVDSGKKNHISKYDLNIEIESKINKIGDCMEEFKYLMTSFFETYNLLRLKDQ
jgi:hypothetical protein